MKDHKLPIKQTTRAHTQQDCLGDYFVAATSVGIFFFLLIKVLL
jgi:hypothetical protein